MKKSGSKGIAREWWEIETVQDKVKPLRKLSGAATAKMGAELSDASLKLLIASLRRGGKLKELDKILWGNRSELRRCRKKGG